MSGRQGQRVYSDALAQDICEQLCDGKSLEAVCRSRPGMPTPSVVRRWANPAARECRPDFAANYAQARAIGYQKMAEEIIDICDAAYLDPNGFTDAAAVQQARLRSDNRKWLLSKMLPKQFGDKVTQEITGDPNAPLVTRIELVPIMPVSRVVTSAKLALNVDHEDAE